MNDENSEAGTVFVVDDDLAVRDSLATLLGVYGFGVEAYESVAAFTRAYRAKTHGCLIIDQHMPVLTGLDFLDSGVGKRLALPVILVTAQNDDQIRARAKDAGVFAFLVKPVDGDALMAVVARAVAHSNRTPCGTGMGETS